MLLSPRAVLRLLFSAVLLSLLGIPGVTPWASGLESGFAADSALTTQRPTPNAQRSTLNAQGPTPNAQRLTPDAHIVHPPAWMDRNGNHVEDRLERVYRAQGKAGLQAPGAPPVADLMLCLDHPPTAEDLARFQAMG